MAKTARVKRSRLALSTASSVAFFMTLSWHAHAHDAGDSVHAHDPASAGGDASDPAAEEVPSIPSRASNDPLRVWPEPWSDNDPARRPSRIEFGPIGFSGGAEYRATATFISPLNVNSDFDRKLSFFDHRLRLDGAVDYKDMVRIVASVDALEGTLWGDNGSYEGSPASTSGANVNTTNVNNARMCIVQTNPNAPVDANSYKTGLCPGDPLLVRRIYGEVRLPFGLLRVGRQPFTLGSAVAVNDGDGRKNRFGISYRGNTADRILFATKPLEAFKPKDRRDTSENEGLFLILAYDKLVQDDLHKFADDVQEWNSALRFLSKDHFFGKDMEARLFHTYRWDRKNDSHIHAIGTRFTTRFLGDFYAGFDAAVVLGKTREVAEAFRLITNDPAVSQTIRQLGARGVIRYDRPKYTFYMEADYASGDNDPQVRTALTQYRFAEDTNVGLLMFEHILAYQTARAAAGATQLLRGLNAPTIPVESIATRGSFTNAFALFPQADVRPIKNLLIRGGVLFAWAPETTIDPVASQQKRDGQSINDDLVNYVGGKPGNYYGTEIDLRVQYRFMNHFALDMEGAYLFAGNALQDRNGYAVNSLLVQGRTTFFF
jgi:hypothetical protein